MLYGEPVTVEIDVHAAHVVQLADTDRKLGVIREVVGGAEDSQGTVAEELVDVPPGLDEGVITEEPAETIEDGADA